MAKESARSGPRIIIVGAGIAGILMGIKLRERGWTDFTIYEKADRLGGTWRDNVYPGVACDVAAHLYVYSFAPNPEWRTRYAAGSDIWNYYNGVATRHGVLPHIRTGKEVVSTNFDGRGWQVETADGDVAEADIVIIAVGRLHHPVMPDIPGKDSFAGPAFHTARWDRSVDLAGKRIGVIGTGSTATQLVSAIADEVNELKVFQRTPQWVFPLPNTPIPVWRRLLFRTFPTFAKRYYFKLRDETEMRIRQALGDARAREARDNQCLDALATIRDPELRAKLTPDYAVGCKRLVISGSFHEAIQKPSVDLVTEEIDHVAPEGVVTRDGTLHRLDLLVFATGFNSQAYLRPMKVMGEDGIALDQVWADLALTYRSIAIPHMPNFFMINGPYSPGGSASVVGIVEVQVDYILQLLDRAVSKDTLLTPREEASLAWLETVRERARGTVWGTGGCNSWYLDASGTPTIDPTPLSDLAAQLSRPDFNDFIERPRPRPIIEPAPDALHGEA